MLAFGRRLPLTLATPGIVLTSRAGR